MKNIIYKILLTIGVAVMIVGCLSSCLTTQKAKDYLKEKDKLAEICAETYPVKEVYIKGDSVTVLDTLYVGENVYDTLTTTDTVTQVVTKTITKTLPPKLITKTIRITDTVRQENTARVAAMQIEINALKADNQFKDLQIADLKQSRNKFRLWFWILVGAIGLYTALKIKKILPF